MPDFSVSDSSGAVWVPPRGLDLVGRVLMRGMAMLARRHVPAVTGIEHVGPEHDPYILAANHTARREALTLPAVLALLRRGRLVHFLGDWNFRLYPGLNFLYRRS